jgi:hypothetical protein
MPGEKKDDFATNGKLKRREYERELARLLCRPSRPSKRMQTLNPL